MMQMVLMRERASVTLLSSLKLPSVSACIHLIHLYTNMLFTSCSISPSTSLILPSPPLLLSLHLPHPLIPFPTSFVSPSSSLPFYLSPFLLFTPQIPSFLSPNGERRHCYPRCFSSAPSSLSASFILPSLPHPSFSPPLASLHPFSSPSSLHPFLHLTHPSISFPTPLVYSFLVFIPPLILRLTLPSHSSILFSTYVFHPSLSPVSTSLHPSPMSTSLIPPSLSPVSTSLIPPSHFLVSTPLIPPSLSPVSSSLVSPSLHPSLCLPHPSSLHPSLCLLHRSLWVSTL